MKFNFMRYQQAGTGKRLKGFPRYTELLERELKRFLIVNFLTILGFAPLIVGVFIAILSSSILVLIPACIIGGAIAGPSLSCMYDAIFRSLRDAPGKCIKNYKRAFKQNWKSSIIPGIIFCLLLGFYIFMLMMFWWSGNFPQFGTITIYILGLTLLFMFFSVYWSLLTLFEQSGMKRFHNCILFIIQFFWKVLGCSLLQILYWAFMILFLPWTVFLLPLIGIWFILFTTSFLLYDTFNNVFHIEEYIAQDFPEQIPFYEDDEEWLKRKQNEQSNI